MHPYQATQRLASAPVRPILVELPFKFVPCFGKHLACPTFHVLHSMELQITDQFHSLYREPNTSERLAPLSHLEICTIHDIQFHYVLFHDRTALTGAPERWETPAGSQLF